VLPLYFEINRYYSNAYGRFMTPDVSRSCGGPSNPQSWNHYAYTAGDPVNRNDPAGLDYVECGEGEAGCTNEAFIDFNQGRGGYCDPSQANCGNACVAPDGPTQMPSPSCSVSGRGLPAPEYLYSATAASHNASSDRRVYFSERHRYLYGQLYPRSRIPGPCQGAASPR
jgi:RHS repeat-associated protein